MIIEMNNQQIYVETPRIVRPLEKVAPELLAHYELAKGSKTEGPAHPPGPAECIPVDKIGGCINVDEWNVEIKPGIVRSTIVEPNFTRDGVQRGTLQGHTTVDSRNQRMEVTVGGSSGRRGVIGKELSGQMRIVDPEGQILDQWHWSKVVVAFPDGSSRAFDSTTVGPR